MNTTDIPVIKLKKGREIAVKRRHPWVFSGAVSERSGTVARGCYVQVRSFDGEVLGYGHWGTKGIAVRMLAFGGQEVSEHDVLNGRIVEAQKVRTALDLFNGAYTTGFRLIHGEGDGLPGLVVDLYGSTIVVQCHSAGMWRLRSHIAESLQAELGDIVEETIFRRVEGQIEDDSRKTSVEDDGVVPEPSKVVAFSENGLRFLADVTGGQKT